jgi:excinuclease ABC subunit C
MTADILRKKIGLLPQKPGIYLFKDAGNKPLYIGKALNLKNRVGHYLKTEDTRLQRMILEAKKVDFIKTESDIEALILESQYIKKFKPTFNIVLRDDKQYFYVGFTDEKYSKIFLTHQPPKPESRIKNKEFRLESPILNSKFKILNSHHIGPFTDGTALKTTLRLLRKIFPYCTCRQQHNNYCLNYHIGKCLGFCCLKNPAANDLQLTTYKKNIKAIKDILNGKKHSLTRQLEKKMHELAKGEEFEEAIELQYKIEKLKKIFENARIIREAESAREYASGLESLLKFNSPIVRIEGYDVSNIQGLNATGSMVTFVNGQPDKNYYRKFKILSKQTPDDTAMLSEVLERRFKHNEWPFPDLILIDGGKGQIQAAKSVLSRLNISIPVIGISKDDRHLGHQIVIPGKSWKIIPLTEVSNIDRNLLLRIDSEAHRFAISFYRHLHRKSI